jgi:hypothetical protein
MLQFDAAMSAYRRELGAKRATGMQVGLNESFSRELERCDALTTGSQRHSCFAQSLATMPSWPSSQEVMDYFYRATPYPGIRFRLPGCVQPEFRGRNLTVMTQEMKVAARRSHYDRMAPWDMIWQHDESLGPECLWGNMPFGKSVLIILLARALGVNYLIESGRMGGMSLLHYAHFGLRLWSIELLPVKHVEVALVRRIPTLVLQTGSGMTLVPQAIREIRSRDADARIAVVLDGPKSTLARSLARTIINETSLVVVDDEEVPRRFRESWPFSTAQSADSSWRARFPMSADARSISATPPNPPEMQHDASRYCVEHDDAAILLGARAFPRRR